MGNVLFCILLFPFFSKNERSVGYDYSTDKANFIKGISRRRIAEWLSRYVEKRGGNECFLFYLN